MSAPACTCGMPPKQPDSILDFGRLLLLERNRLVHVTDAFSSRQYFVFYVIDFHFFFLCPSSGCFGC